MVTERQKSESGKPTADGQVLTEKSTVSQNVTELTDHTGVIREFHTAAAWTEKTWLCQHIPVFLHQLIIIDHYKITSSFVPRIPKLPIPICHTYATYMLPICYLYATYKLPICYLYATWDAVKDSQSAKVEPILQV